VGTKERIAGVLAITLSVMLATGLAGSQAAQHITSIAVVPPAPCPPGYYCYFIPARSSSGPWLTVLQRIAPPTGHPWLCAQGETFHLFPGYGSTFPWRVRICTR
jgi:hypothetical protein